MTLQDAIGVRMANIDKRTGETLTHSEVYGRAIDYLGGLDEVARFIPFPLEALREKLKGDPHLNNTAMSWWDAASGFVCRGGDCKLVGGGIWELYLKHGVTSASNADGVCILKEAARRLVEREEAAK